MGFRAGAFSAVALAALAGAGCAEAFTLHVLHINDFHSRVEPINKFNSTCSSDEYVAGECFGGYARLKTAVDAARAAAAAKGEPVLLLSGGDQFQGSLFFSAYKGSVEAEFMNLLGFDAMVLGNHEFDLGPKVTADFIEAVDFPVIFGNTDASADEPLSGLVPDPVVLDVNGTRVAILGALTPDTAEISSPGDEISFLDPAEYLAGAVAALEAEGVNHIIALTHLGTPADIAVAEQVAGLDLIVGGHHHALFSNTVADARYPYPLMVAGESGAETPVVSAGAYGRYLGHAVLEFNDAGEVTAISGDTELMDSSIEPDPEIAARISELAGPIKAIKERVVAELGVSIDGSRETCRSAECPMGNLVADAMLARTGPQGISIAIQNGGGLRASIDAGVVTMGEVLAVLPFQNTLSTFNLSGAGIIAALENGVSQVEEGGGRFPQVAGLKFSWDASVPPSEGRVGGVVVLEGGTWVPVDPEKTYGVVTNNFMRNGGDGYDVFLDEGTNAYDFGPGLEEVLAEYLVANPDYQPTTDGRITRLN